MPIQDSDLLLIETTSGVSSKIEASKLKANLAANTYNNYKLLVNKPDYTSRFVYAQNMQASVGLTDYMMVERAGVSYKVNGQQIIDYFPSVPAGAAGPITGVEDGTAPIVTFTFVEEEGGKFASTSDYQKLIDGNINTEAESNDGKPSGGSPNTGKKLGYIQLDPPIPVNSYVKIYQRGNAGSRTWILNNQASTEKPTVTVVTTEGQTWTASELSVDELSVISMVSAIDAGNSFRMSALEVDGVIYKGTASSISVGTTGGGYYTTLTLAGDTNLDLFTAGDAIRMVNEDGDVASYTPVTSTIANVAPAPESTAAYYVTASTPPNGVNSNPSLAKLFDGDPNTWCDYKSDTSFTLTFSNLPTAQSLVRIKGYIGQPYTQKLTAYFSNGQTLAFEANTKYYELTLTSPATLVEIVGVAASSFAQGYGVSIIEMDGKEVTTAANATLLTFASPNQDLKYFNAGDNLLVPKISSSVTFTSSSGSFTSGGISIYDSGNVANSQTGTGPLGSRYLDLTFSPAISVKSTVVVNVGGDAPSQAVSINGGAYSPQSNSGTQTFPFTGNLTSLRISSDSNIRNAGRIRYLEIDGSKLELEPPLSTSTSSPQTAVGNYQPIVAVISTDTAANTMVVDGGTWSNGEVVTGPAKSGTGNFSSNTGPVVDVSNSNQQWIDNDNRLGENFFIKSASTRTGLAILRTKAVNAAIAIAASAKEQLEDGEFGIVNGNYWFRDEDTFIDLGPINLPSK